MAYKPDTSEEAQKIYDDLIRKLSPEERFLRGIQLTMMVREMCFSNIKSNHPEMTPDQVRAEFIRRVYPQFQL